ncbi:PQQ-like beta-propeller repeat protein [Anaerobaca lacustris]|uniref:PQQ-binding-like beta-propeller repeat protein n=1 Tax=Anaerobaca lacustris TaxID=3044600 RepID=A0AAW6TZD1_9BACT|nr:PQQ-binding-like beta-propeller repeat protein [Sedimentisphaerales bacterium M17dextr]
MLQLSLSRTVSACLVLFLCAASRGENWPQFRGPGGLGVSQTENLPITWSETENVAWKTPLPGYGASSPIALAGRLYVTCHSGYGTERDQTMEDLALHVVCVDGENGAILWDRQIEPTLPESPRVRDHGYAAATPATDGEHLYVFFGKSGVFKFDLDGRQLWRTNVGTGIHGWGSGTSPVLYEDLVIVNASVESESLMAMDKETGKEVWRAGGIRESWNTPHLVRTSDGRHELAVSIRGWVMAFDPKTGKELWRCAAIPDYVCPSIVSHESILYAIGGRASKAFAIRSGGRGDVTDTHKLWQADVGANVSSPVVHDGHLYWVSDRNQVAYCLRMADGEVIYAERVRMQPYASTLLADGRLYVVMRNGGTLVLAARSQFEQLAHNQLADRSTFNGSPIVHNGMLILRSDENLYALKESQ